MKIYQQSIPVCNEQTIKANYNATINDDVMLFNATGGNIVVNLPNASVMLNSNTPFFLKKLDASANTITITPAGGQLIDGAATYVLTTQNQAVILFSDGSNWSVLSANNTSAGSGTVTAVSVTTANGVSGSVANPTTTPAITLTLGANAYNNLKKLTITDSPYTAATFNTLFVDATGGAVTINLPAAAASTNVAYTIKKTDSSANIVTIDPNASELIDGALTKIIFLQNTSVTAVCDGTAWGIT